MSEIDLKTAVSGIVVLSFTAGVFVVLSIDVLALLVVAGGGVFAALKTLAGEY